MFIPSNLVQQYVVHDLLTHYNKHVDIQMSEHESFLELPSSSTLKIGRLESQIIYSFWSNDTKEYKAILLR
jgi:hypothetical protein